MKKIAKIVTLLVAFVIIMTMLSVVLMAAEKEQLMPVVANSMDFESYSENDVVKNSSSKPGKWTIAVADNDNKYVVAEYESASGSSGDNWDISISDTSKYDILEYPMFAFDFDVMSTTGTYASSATIRTDLYGGSSQSNRITTMSANKLDDIKLSSEAYVWNHVTVVVNYSSHGIFDLHFFVNGTQTLTKVLDYTETNFKSQTVTTVTSWTDLTDEKGELAYDNIRVAAVTLYPVTSENSGKICYDNFKFTYFPSEYLLEDVVSYTYNDKYEMPYGKTVATVTDNKTQSAKAYDSFTKALDAANENDTITLFADANGEINKAVTIDANGYNFTYSLGTDCVRDDSELNLYKFISLSSLYDGVYIDKDGNRKYFNGYLGFEEAVEAVMSSAQAGTKSKVRTIILYNDIEYYKSFKFSRYTNLTIDLNGNSLTRTYLYGDVYSRSDAGGEYVKESSVSKSDQDKNAFILGFDVTFSINSSKPGGEFRTVSVNGNSYYTGETFEYYTAKSLAGAGFIRQNSNVSRIKLTVDQISIFAENIIYQEKAVGENIELVVSDCKFYKTVPQGATLENGYNCIFFASSGPINVTLTNSLFYFPDADIIGNENVDFMRFTRGNDKTFVGDLNVTVTNCDIISDNTAVSVYIANSRTKVVFDNSRIFNISNSNASYKPTIMDGTISTTEIAEGSVVDGCYIFDKANSIDYNLPVTNVSIDSLTGCPSYSFEFKDKNVSFTKEAMLYHEVHSIVSWFDENGELIKTTDELKNSTIVAPEYIAEFGDGYRGIKVNNWLDENGNVASFIIGDADNYSFKANPIIDENTEYTAKVTEAQFNFIFHTGFTTVLYLPCREGMAMPSVLNFQKGDSTVKINGEEYWSFFKENTTTDVSEDLIAVVDFTINGNNYSQSLTLNALIYAQVILSSPENDIEARAIANMIRYIKEARTTAGLEISDRFAEVELLYSLDDYKNKEDYNNIDTDVSELVGYVDSMHFMIHGSSVSYVVTLTSTAIEKGAGLSVRYADTGKELLLSKSTLAENAFYTNNTKVYDLTEPIEITVNVTEGDAEKTVTGTYSLGAYIAAMDNSLAKAMYEFGIAAATYKEYLLAKYDPTNPEVTLYNATFMADGVFAGEAQFNIADEKINAPAVPFKEGYTGVWEKYAITNRDIIVNAVYTPITYSITYNVNNAYATNDNKSTYTIESDTFEIVAPTSAGDIFYGWYLDADFTIPANTTVVKGSVGDIVLYANWDCIHDVGIIERVDPAPLKDGYEVTNCLKCRSHELTEFLPATKSIKILSIGNSFSVDVFTYLGSILNAEGVEEITLGILYHGGYGIGDHWNAMNSGNKVYTLYLSNSKHGITAQTEKVNLEYGIQLEDWDVITMHQSLKDYGNGGNTATTSKKVSDLVNYIKGINPDAKLYSQISWPYSTEYLLTNPDKAYGFESHLEMYNAIVNAVKEVIDTNDAFSLIIPAGTAIQNIRTSYIGDAITRDGVHLNTLGRYAASLTWFAMICGLDNVDDVTYKLSSISEYDFAMIKEAVNNALENPYEITPSTYTTAPTTE